MTTSPTYVPRVQSRSRFVTVRGLRHHVREWGAPEARPLVLLHGGRDSSANFQFIVDALEGSWRVLAPDWRGHGRTPLPAAGGYWTSDLLCDLDGLFAELGLTEPVPLLGHSMGGNIASVYAGIRPNAVSHLIILDALGGRLETGAVEIATVLSDLLEMERIRYPRRAYADVEALTARLLEAHPRLDPARARFLSAENAISICDGMLSWPHDPNFNRSWPTLHSVEEWGACWSRITAPVLCVLASHPMPHSPTRDPEIVAARTRYFHNVTVRTAPDTGHNVHQEAPEIVARWLEDFVGA